MGTFVGAGNVKQRTKTMETPDVFRANFQSTAVGLAEASNRSTKIETTGRVANRVIPKQILQGKSFKKGLETTENHKERLIVVECLNVA